MKIEFIGNRAAHDRQAMRMIGYHQAVLALNNYLRLGFDGHGALEAMTIEAGRMAAEHKRAAEALALSEATP